MFHVIGLMTCTFLEVKVCLGHFSSIRNNEKVGWLSDTILHPLLSNSLLFYNTKQIALANFLNIQ